MTVKSYDIILVLDPKLTENNIRDLITKAKKLISSMGGEILTEDNWGIKKITHPIKGNKEGFYYFIKVKMNGDKNTEIKYNLKITEGIIRVNLIKSKIEVVK
ncbi:MAG: 30S ribosomal protein S6 [Elusimicrobiota bacterium]